MNYKKYRVFLTTTSGGFIPATSKTVNDLVELLKYWLERTTDGMYLPDNVSGTITLQQIDKVTGAYVNNRRLPFNSKKDLVTQARKLGAR